MSNRKSLPATLLLIAGLAASSLPGARADDKCLAKPNAPAPKGQHWYYRHDRAKHLCWYLREQGLPVSKHAPQAAHQPAPQAAAQSAAPPIAPPQAAPEAPATDGNFTTAAAPVPFLAAMDLAMTTSAARPAASRAADNSSQSASAGPLPVSARVTTGMGDHPPQAERRTATSAVDPPPPARERVRPPPRPAAAPAPVAAAGEVDQAFALFMLLLAGLAVAGILFHVARRRRRAFEATAFRPPAWARVVALNAPTPRVRVPLPRTPKDEPAQRPAAVARAPAEHTERLAQALQQLADRLRSDPETAPSIVPRQARPAPRSASARLYPERLRPGDGMTRGIEKLREQR